MTHIFRIAKNINWQLGSLEKQTVKTICQSHPGSYRRAPGVTTRRRNEGKNGKVAHNRNGTAVQTSNGTAVHARGSSTVRSTNGAYHAGDTNRAAVHTNNGTAVHTNANWDNTYWHSNRYGYWNGQHGYWQLVGGRHVFVVVN